MTSKHDVELPRVAYLGPEGTYSHQVAFDRFGSSVNYVKKNTIADVYASLAGEAQLALLPKENSIFGPVIETFDILRSPDIGFGQDRFIREEIVLQVQHCLIVPRGTALNSIKRILSHEQALGQCSIFLKENLPDAALVKMSSTAAAAAEVLSAGNSAAICSKVCASVYAGLEILHEGIQNENINFTAFWLLSVPRAYQIPGANIRAQLKNALIRVSCLDHQVDSAKRDIILMLIALNLHVARIDRRPSLEAIPFHDVYFVQVKRNDTSQARTTNSTDEDDLDRGETLSWEKDVDKALERILKEGWEGSTLGFW